MGCWFAGQGPCGYGPWMLPTGLPDRAHWIPKQRLRDAGLTDADVWDPRVWTWMCRRHHHRFDQGFVQFGEYDYPAQLRAFAERHRFAYDQRQGWVSVVGDAAPAARQEDNDDTSG